MKKTTTNCPINTTTCISVTFTTARYGDNMVVIIGLILELQDHSITVVVVMISMVITDKNRVSNQSAN